MNVVDSSAWLEFFKTLCRQRSEADALRAIEAMHQGRVIDLSAELALRAAQLSLEHSLPMADASILATAYAEEAELWTQDADFEALRDVRYFPR